MKVVVVVVVFIWVLLEGVSGFRILSGGGEGWESVLLYTTEFYSFWLAVYLFYGMLYYSVEVGRGREGFLDSVFFVFVFSSPFLT